MWRLWIILSGFLLVALFYHPNPWAIGGAVLLAVLFAFYFRAQLRQRSR